MKRFGDLTIDSKGVYTITEGGNRFCSTHLDDYDRYRLLSDHLAWAMADHIDNGGDDTVLDALTAAYVALADIVA